MSPSVRRALVVAALLLLPLALFHRALFLGEAFVPADLLGHLSPWKAAAPDPPATAWNVLRFDGVAEFYPWRLEAARQMRSGRIPLWNEYALGAHGGTPLLADSQSAPLYPLTALFYLFPPAAAWYAFGLSAALHLAIAAAGMYRLLRDAAGLRRIAGVLGATVFCLSGPVVCWLSLPTFLAVTCWLPWLLLLLHHAHAGAGTRAGRLAAAGAGAVAGTMLLAGHLQMAFYGLLAAGLFALWRGVGGLRTRAVRPGAWAGLAALGLTLAVALALPQVLPALEFSRGSHRAAEGGASPSMEAYRAYTANALPVRNLVTLVAPDFFGHPNPPDSPYWNTNNYGEWAAYVGIAPLLLASFALALPWRGGTMKPGRGYGAALGGGALLLSMGTPLNLPLFFLVPGYSQTGNPGRALVLVALALALLAAHGLDALLSSAVPAAAKKRAALIGVAAPALLAAWGASQAAAFAGANGFPFGQLLAAAMPGIQIGVVLLLLTAAALFGLSAAPERYRPLGGALLVALTFLDLYAWGGGYNPTVPAARVFPETPGIAFLRENGRDALIAPLNTGWSIAKVPPRGAVLPPNTLTVYGLHDLGGYDSLLPAAAKARVRDAGGNEDPSPPENGNMVFVKRAETAIALGARYLVLSPERAAGTPIPAGLRAVYVGDDLVIWENPAGRAFDPARARAYRPDSFRVGLFCGLAGVGALAALFAGYAAGKTTARARRGSPPSSP